MGLGGIRMADITSNLLHWWKADEGSGTNLADSGSTPKAGTLAGSATWFSPGRIGAKGLSIPGYVTSDYGRVQCAAPSGINGLTNFSLGFWFKPLHTGDYVNGVVASALWQGDYNSRFEILNGQAAAPRDLHIAICNGAASWVWVTNCIPNDANMHHVLVTYDGTQATDALKVKLYIDGVAVAIPAWNAAVPASLPANTLYGWQFGRRVDNTGPAKCNLDDIRVYIRTLTAADAALLVQYTGAASQWEHVVSVKAGSANGISVTSSNVDTRGADVGFAVLGSVASFGQQPLFDNQGNYWKPVFSQSHSGGVLATLYTCENLRTSATHNLFTGAIGNSPGLAATFYKGHRTVSMTDLSDYLNTGNAATFSPPNGITPTVNDALVLSLMASFAGSTAPIVDSNLFYQSYSCNALGNHMGIGLGRIVQATAALAKPAWTTGSTGDHVTAVLSFKPRLAGDDITVNELEDGCIYQHTDGNATIPVSGKYYGTAPSSVEIQSNQNATTNQIQAYTPVSSLVASGGDWSGTITLPAVNYYHGLLVRSKDGSGTVLATGNQTAGRTGIGFNLVFFGQSNAARMFDTYAAPASDALTRMFGPTNKTNWFTVTGDGARTTANYLRSLLSMPIGLINCAVSGSGLAYDAGNGKWDSLTAGQPWPNAQLILTAMHLKIGGVVFIGCEADTFNASGTKAGIKTAFVTLKTRLLAHIGQSDVIFGVGILGLNTSGTDAVADDIRQAQIETGDEIGIIACNLLDAPIAAGDSPHLTGPGYTNNGRHIAQAFAHALGAAAYGKKGGPRFGEASLVSSTKIRIEVLHDGGTDLKEYDGTTDGNSLTGFEVSTDNFATTKTISSTQFNNGVVELTLSAPTTIQGLQYRYLHGKSPTVTKLVYDNTTPNGATYGYPVLPKAATSISRVGAGSLLFLLTR